MADTTFIDRATNIQASWLNDVNTSTYKSVKNTRAYGTTGNGTTDDTSAMNTAMALGSNFTASSGTYKFTNTISFGSSSYSVGKNTIHTNTVLFGYSVASGSEINGGTYNTTGGVAFNFATNAINVAIRNVNINDTSVSNGTAVNLNANGIQNVRLHGNNISANSFGVLTNSGGTVDGLIISASYIQALADPIELNAPAVSHQNIIVSGNVLRANGPGTAHVSGFAIGVAGSKNTAIIGNAIQESVWEAVHIEDKQETVTVVGNVGQNLHGDFYRAGNGGLGGTGGGGVPVIGNNAKSYAAGLSNYGAFLVFDGAGSVPGSTLIGNRFIGFDGGILGGREDAIVQGNVLESCGVAGIQSNGGGSMYGTNLLRNTPVFVKTLSGATLGRVVSDSAPTTILDTSSHSANTIGTVLEDGFAFRNLNASVVGGSVTTQVNLFSLPLLLKGRLIVRLRQSGGNAFIYASADILWDGTTLTVSTPLNKVFSSIAWSGTTFNQSGGFIRMPVFNSGSTFTGIFDVNFKGEFYN